MSNEPIKVFLAYSDRDGADKDELLLHLSILRRQGAISICSDRIISLEHGPDPTIAAELSSADIILLMVSPDFLASDYCWGVEIQQAMQRHEAGEACVIPVLLRWVDWQTASFAKCQVLPRLFRIGDFHPSDFMLFLCLTDIKNTLANKAFSL